MGFKLKVKVTVCFDFRIVGMYKPSITYQTTMVTIPSILSLSSSLLVTIPSILSLSSSLFELVSRIRFVELKTNTRLIDKTRV